MEEMGDVRSKKKYPLPTGSIIFKTTTDYESVLTKMKDMYFPMGKCILGRISSYHCTLGSSKEEPVDEDNFSPYSFMTECQTLVPRLYLMTKEKIPHHTDSSSEEFSDNSGSNLSPERMDYESPNTSPRARPPVNLSSQMTGVKFNSSHLQDSVQQTQSRHFHVHAGTSSVGPSQLSDQISPQPNTRQGQLTPMAAASSYSINVHAGTPSNKVAKPLKVLSADRMLRKGIVATSFNDLQTKSPDAHSSQPSQHGQEIIAYIEKINTKKRKLDSSNGSERNSVPEKIKISPGWKHFSYKDNNYIQVRSRVNSPIPSGDILMSSTSDYQTTLKEMEKVYFPNGKSIKGKLSRMETSLGSSKGQLKPDGFTPDYFAKQLCSTQKPRLYLLSKKKIPDLFVTDDDDSSESSLPDPQLPPTCSSGLTPMVSSFISSDQVNPGPSFMFNATSSMCTTPTLATQSGGFSHCTLTPPAPNHDSFVVHAGTPTVEMMLPSTSRKCTICMDREVDAFVVPCGHSLCLVCGIHFHTNKKACPVCRGIIQDVKGIYFA